MEFITNSCIYMRTLPFQMALNMEVIEELPRLVNVRKPKAIGMASL